MAEGEKIRTEMEQNQTLLEEHQVERERQQVEEICRDEGKNVAEELERKRLEEERMEELQKAVKRWKKDFHK